MFGFLEFRAFGNVLDALMLGWAGLARVRWGGLLHALKCVLVRCCRSTRCRSKRRKARLMYSRIVDDCWMEMCAVGC